MAALAADPLFLCVTRVSTFWQGSALTNASGFFFERGARLYLVTSRHVVIDEPSNHLPDRLEIELHTDAENLALSDRPIRCRCTRRQERCGARAATRGASIDVAVIELDRSRAAAGVVLRAFTPAHLCATCSDVRVGEPLLVVGFPAGLP